MMGSRSFNAWPQVEDILDSIPDGRNVSRHKHLPMIITPAEREGVPVVGRAWKSKSLLINEAIMHYTKPRENSMSFADLHLSIARHQDYIKQLHEEIEELKGRVSLWHRIFG